MARPLVGEVAPDFTLPSTAGADVTLSALRGRKVLLAFFPAAFTGVCTEEMCGFSHDFEKFAAAGTVVLPISVDAIPSLKEFKAKERLLVDLVSDSKREVARRYDLLNEERFVAQRAYLLLDRDGVIRWMHVEETPAQRREHAELFAAIAAVP